MQIKIIQILGHYLLLQIIDRIVNCSGEAVVGLVVVEVMKIKRKLLLADFKLNFAWIMKIFGLKKMAADVELVKELNLDLIIN